MVWVKESRRQVAGYWFCRVRKREQHRRYNQTPRGKLRNRKAQRVIYDARDDLLIAEIEAKLLALGVDLGST